MKWECERGTVCIRMGVHCAHVVRVSLCVILIIRARTCKALATVGRPALGFTCKSARAQVIREQIESALASFLSSHAACCGSRRRCHPCCFSTRCRAPPRRSVCAPQRLSHPRHRLRRSRHQPTACSCRLWRRCVVRRYRVRGSCCTRRPRRTTLREGRRRSRHRCSRCSRSASPPPPPRPPPPRRRRRRRRPRRCAVARERAARATRR